jgi:hypothetical protein
MTSLIELWDVLNNSKNVGEPVNVWLTIDMPSHTEAVAQIDEVNRLTRYNSSNNEGRVGGMKYQISVLIETPSQTYFHEERNFSDRKRMESTLRDIFLRRTEQL